MRNHPTYLSLCWHCFVIFICLIGAGFGTKLAAQQQTFTITKLQDSYVLNDHLSVLAVENDNIDIEDILSDQYASSFEIHDVGNSLPFDGIHWLKVKVDNNLQTQRVFSNWKLFVGNADQIELYVVSPEREILDRQVGGSMYASTIKALKFGNKYNRVDINLPDKYPLDIYLKLKKVNKSKLEVELVLSKLDFYQSWNYIKRIRMEWLLLGFFITMMVFNFLFFTGTTDKAFLYHGFFILGVIVFNLEYFAITHDLLIVRDNPILKQIIDYIGLAIADIAYYQFIRYFLHLDQVLPKWDKLFKSLIYVKIIVFSFVIIHYAINRNIPLTDTIVAFFYISQYIIVAVFFIPLLRIKDRKAFFFILGSILLFLGIFANGVRVIQGHTLILFPTLIGITGEILCFSLGLGYRMKRLQDEALEEERKTVERLKEIDALKNQFLANTSHELKTPLQGIIGLSENLLEKEKDSKKSEDLSLIINSGTRLNSLVNDILDFSKLKNNDLNLNIKPIDISILVEIVLRMVQPLLKNKSLELINNINGNIPRVMADENRLQQVLYNLVNNAIKFTRQGHIKLSAVIDEGMLHVSVSDTGIGIAPEKQQIIFEEFQQADASISREFSGTGLGLSISKQLIEKQGGTILLDSTPGQGSTFTFTLPLENPDAEMSPALEHHTGIIEDIKALVFDVDKDNDIAPTPIPVYDGSDTPGTFNILIVDDEPINQHVLTGYLDDPLYSVRSVMNGNEAIELIHSDKNIDLVLLDLMMPGMSGYEVCSKIRDIYLPSELPIIMVTAKNQMRDLIQGFKLGANDYLTKPFTRLEFLARVKTQLNLTHISKATNRFVPNDFIKSLGRETITEVRLGDHTEQTVSVLFSDIRGYTSIAENMSLTENFNFVLDHVSAMGPIIVSNNGFVNQYLGDSIMAIFGQSPVDALRAAVEMQQQINISNTRLNELDPKLEIGIGFHTGDLMMGIIGDKFHSKPVTIADTVNIASRIESLTKYFGTKIMLSEASLESISDRDEFEMRYLGQVQLKGKSKQLGLYECINGDEDPVYEMKKATLDQFKTGIDYYFSKRFAKATVVFQEIIQHNPEDEVSRHFLRKAADCISNGVEEDWTGLLVMDIK
ncbi:MAG: response regulator [Saprospiraceae bacterium]|nr:response regulator [Saprospiraceae bacterium]